MMRYSLYTGLLLIVVVAGVANWLRRPRMLPKPTVIDVGTQLNDCMEAITEARRLPYWRSQPNLAAARIVCRPAPGGWRLTVEAAGQVGGCELYVGRDRLVAPRLPCNGVGDDS